MAMHPRLLLLLLLALLLTACAARGVRIADLKDRPGRYDDRTISVTGVVTRNVSLLLVPYQVYYVDDGSGEIIVVSRARRAPLKGARVQVTGRLNELASFGTQSFGLHIDERDRKIKG